VESRPDSQDRPLVSCIVPVYNGEPYLRETLASILSQTYAPVELIVVDDGSTDGTEAIARGCGDRLRYLRQANAGPAAARNSGIGAASGSIVAFLDADDLWHPEKLTLQVARFGARPELDVCLSHIRNFWVADLAAEEEAQRDHFRAGTLPGYSSVTMAARRGVFDRVGTFSTDLKHGADADWFARAEEAGAVFEMLPEVLVERRLHGGNRSRQWSERSREEILRTMKSIVDRRRAQQGKR
jgi:glycosyltransferase involved in cell wall biosynthesis